MRIISRLNRWSRAVRTEMAFKLHPPRRLLFDHLPKCAGTAVTSYLQSFYPRRTSFIMSGSNPQSSVEQFQGLTHLDRDRFFLVSGHLARRLFTYTHPESLRVTILRNPVNRIVSHYYYVKEQPTHYLHKEITSKGMCLDEYVTSGISNELRNWYASHFSDWNLPEKVLDCETTAQEVVASICANYDLVGFQEQLPEVMAALAQVARLNLPFDNRVVNRTNKRPGSHELDSRVRDLIAEYNAIDMRIYDLLRVKAGTRGYIYDSARNPL